MGSSSSKKVDTYVIKMEEDAKLSGGVKPKKGGLSPTKQNSEVGLDSSPSALTKSKSAVLDRRKSAPNLNMKMKSSNDMATTSSRKLTTSATVPWLLKGPRIPHGASLKDYEMGRIIGRGFMGTVRIVKQIKTDKYLVFKAIRKDAVSKSRSQRHLQSEKHVLNTLNSPFCVKLFGTFQDKQHLYFALEFCAGGELCNRLDKKKYFPPEVAKFYIAEIFVAVEHLQSLGFVYRDLKPENVMIDEDGHCKLVDFGFACSVDVSGKLHTLCGTPCYLSPEQLDGKFTNGYTNIVDWWSFGVLLFELRTGYTPFCKTSRDTNYEIFLRILKKHISYPWGFDKLSRDIISGLCYADPAKRLCDPESIKKHPFFELPWDAVQDRRMIPPHVPKFGAPGDASHFRQHHDPAAAAAEKEREKGKDGTKATQNDSVEKEKELKNEFRNGSGDFMDF